MPTTAARTDAGSKHEAYQAIRRKMIAGPLRPGSRLSEQALSKELGVSRTPIREAIGQLVSEGLVEHVRHTGAFVKKPSRADLEDVFELREWHEAGIAMAAATRITAEQIVRLEKAVQNHLAAARALRQSGTDRADGSIVYRAALAEIDFHMTLMHASGNRRVARVAGDNFILSHIWTSWPERHHLGAVASDYRDHARILRHVRRRDGERARDCMVAHVRQGRETMLAMYDLQQRRTAMSSELNVQSSSSLASLESLIEELRG